MALDAVRNGPVAIDDGVSQILLADTRPTNSLAGSELSQKPALLPNDGSLNIEPIQLAVLDTRFVSQPNEPSSESKKEASALASKIKSRAGGELKDSDKDEIHAAFNKELAKTEGEDPSARAESLRRFVSEVNNKLRQENGKLQFSEDAAGSGDKISFSLVDNGEGNLVAGLPVRTVYDTMEYSLKKGEPVVKNIPERNALPAELRAAYDFTFQNARQAVMKEKYAPALEAVSKEAKLAECKNQEELNVALGLPATSTAADFQNELMKRMMVKVGQPGEDFNQVYGQDVDRAFVKNLDLKPGLATQTEMIGALGKMATKVPKDWKPDLPKRP